MSWSWHYTPAMGAVTSQPDADRGEVGEQSAGFPSQSDAETWLGEEWRTLVAAGVASVTLYEDERKVYGPMDLAPLPE